MSITAATLADGQLPSSKGTLFTAAGIVHVHVVYANTSTGTARTVNLYVKRSGGTSRRIIGVDTDLPAKASLEFPGYGTGLKLSTGDIIEGDASAATAVDYLIYGGTA